MHVNAKPYTRWLNLDNTLKKKNLGVLLAFSQTVCHHVSNVNHMLAWVVIAAHFISLFFGGVLF